MAQYKSKLYFFPELPETNDIIVCHLIRGTLAAKFYTTTRFVTINYSFSQKVYSRLKFFSVVCVHKSQRMWEQANTSTQEAQNSYLYTISRVYILCRRQYKYSDCNVTNFECSGMHRNSCGVTLISILYENCFCAYAQ